jgi:hypothetical protein
VSEYHQILLLILPVAIENPIAISIMKIAGLGGLLMVSPDRLRIDSAKQMLRKRVFKIDREFSLA